MSAAAERRRRAGAQPRTRIINGRPVQYLSRYYWTPEEIALLETLTRAELPDHLMGRYFDPPATAAAIGKIRAVVGLNHLGNSVGQPSARKRARWDTIMQELRAKGIEPKS